MGYTHYWEFNKTERVKGSAAKVEKNYQLAIRDCQRVILAWQREHAKGSSLDYCRLSGYSAHSKVGIYGGIGLNGKGSNSHEDFCLREHYSENGSFNFCKTARKPYDTVVIACLTILKHRLGDLISVSSDGDCLDWIDGVELARRVTKLKIANPIKANQGDLKLVKNG